MRVTALITEAIAVLIPDFQSWGLSAPVFFSLFCCAGKLGLPWAKGTDSGVLISLVLGYVVNVAFNIAGFLSCTSPTTIATSPRLESGGKQCEAPAQRFLPNRLRYHRHSPKTDSVASY